MELTWDASAQSLAQLTYLFALQPLPSKPLVSLKEGGGESTDLAYFY